MNAEKKTIEVDGKVYEQVPTDISEEELMRLFQNGELYLLEEVEEQN